MKRGRELRSRTGRNSVGRASSTRLVRSGILLVFLVGTRSLVVTAPPQQGSPQSVLPRTERLEWDGDPAAGMVAGIHRLLDRELTNSREARARHWKRDFSSWAAYERSVEPNRERFRRITGTVDPRFPFPAPFLSGTTLAPPLLAEGDDYSVLAIRWPVLEGVDGEGLLLQPSREILCRVVALPDADDSPEALVGLLPGIPEESQLARRLAEAGCQVVIPVLIDRTDTWSGNPAIERMNNQTHREWIYRQAFQLGRHVIGFEIQKVLAAVDWFERQNAALEAAGGKRVPLGVAGYGEGGLIAFYSGALDRRIGATLVSGYFSDRRGVWEEPIYRNLFGLLREFGDAEIAGLAAPRAMVIEHSRAPELSGPPPVREGRRATAAPGRLATPPADVSREEFLRALRLFPSDESMRPAFDWFAGDGMEPAAAGGTQALPRFLLRLGVSGPGRPGAPPRLRVPVNALNLQERQRRQVRQLEDFCQTKMLQSFREREEFWKETLSAPAEQWEEGLAGMREYYRQEILGDFPPPSMPANPRTRLAYQTSYWNGYEVVLDVWPEVFAYGILLVPRDLKPGERRPVVVCQHGLEGRPQAVVNPDEDTRAYHSYGARLAERGFIVYAPQNPYIGGHDFRMLNRRANPLGKTFFGVIARQHERMVQWLQNLRFVDPQRIAFYGLSYGGVSAMRLPPLIPEYSLSICSANFNDWVRKIGDTGATLTYLFHHEFEMFGEFNVANRFNYAELAWMIAPRPFMVERGHYDGAGTDEWVAAEFARVHRRYQELGIADRAAIEYFPGGHEIHGKGTFEFLHHHLNWPAPK